MIPLVSVANVEPRYPRSAPFDPSESYPEYPYPDGKLSAEPNAAYTGVREALALLGLDRDRFGTAAWNPLGEIVQRGMTVRYAPDAVVYNTGPDTIHDFVAQRRRNHAGHLYLKSKYGYAVSSMQNTRVAKIALKEIWGAIRLVWALFLLAVLETYSRVLGWYDFAVKKDRHVVWDMAWSQKTDVGAERTQVEMQDDLRPAALASANSKLKVEG